MTRFFRLLAFGLCTLIGSALFYVGLSVVGHVIPGPIEPDDAPRTRVVYLLGDFFHTDIIVPVDMASDTNGSFGGVRPFDNLPTPPRHVAFGWGSRTAYTSLLAITDMSPGLVWKALAFDETVMHVTPVAPSVAFETVGARPIKVTEAGLMRLKRFIASSFARDDIGQPKPLPDMAYGFSDRFYVGKGRFSPFRTCNVWVGEALRRAGVRAGFWTPFAWNLP
ncbi:MAG: TIGR02117 family protein [Pseudomonadota bacterium]